MESFVSVFVSPENTVSFLFLFLRKRIPFCKFPLPFPYCLSISIFPPEKQKVSAPFSSCNTSSQAEKHTLYSFKKDILFIEEDFPVATKLLLNKYELSSAPIVVMKHTQINHWFYLGTSIFRLHSIASPRTSEKPRVLQHSHIVMAEALSLLVSSSVNCISNTP